MAKCKGCTSMRGLSVLGVFITVLGTILLIVWPPIFKSLVLKQVSMTPDSQTYSLWKVVPIPIYMDFYLFNWTNPHEINDPTKKPILHELGPYVFREHREKVVDGWFPKNSTVTYRQNRTWIFEPEMSNGTLDDLITTLNVPAATAVYTLRDAKSYIKDGFSLLMLSLQTKLFVTKSAREFIFDGYKDPLVDLSKFKPGSAPFDKFGWMYPRNGSADYDGIYNMATDGAHVGMLMNWNYQNNTPFFPPPCGAIGGSAGELFPPFQKKGQVEIFSSDICRRLELNFKEEVTVSGIDGYRYWGSATMFANKTSRPSNWCFCGEDGDTCYPDGILNATSCKWGAPVFISYPHFYLADPSYREAVVGLDPQQSRHQFYLDLEPKTGVPLQVSAAFQINMFIQPDKHFGLFKNVPKMFFPTIWFKQRAHINDALKHTLTEALLVPKIVPMMGYVLLSLGISVLVILGIVFISVHWRRDEDAMYLVNNSQHPSQQSS